MKNILALCTHAPYGGNIAKEGLDAILAAGVYEQNLAVVFLDDGVFQLLPNQCSELINQKSISQLLGALELYGIDNIYVEVESLTERNLELDQLTLEHVEPINRAALAHLFHQQHQILTF